MEDHHLVFVVAEDEKEARKLAKTKWEAESIHVDGTQLIKCIDGYNIKLERTGIQDDVAIINSDYSS